ncbi:MAG: sensor histidine kinase [Alistipes onderdonkii]
MTRVIDNLLQNAAKFTAAGSVTVCCDKDDRTRKLRIRVTDTGIGIAPDKQEWVFDRFTKVDSFKPGSGIGLYLCRLIVTRLGGAIRVCPDYRAGCCIEIIAPRTDLRHGIRPETGGFFIRDSPRIAIRT